MKSLTKTNILLLISALVLAFGLLFGSNIFQVKASAPSGLAATIATTSNPTVNTTASLVFATSSCSARIITTLASPIMIGFSDVQGFVPTALIGHLQAASTTVSYDSGIYGCNAVRIYSFASSIITVSESR